MKNLSSVKQGETYTVTSNSPTNFISKHFNTSLITIPKLGQNSGPDYKPTAAEGAAKKISVKDITSCLLS